MSESELCEWAEYYTIRAEEKKAAMDRARKEAQPVADDEEAEMGR